MMMKYVQLSPQASMLAALFLSTEINVTLFPDVDASSDGLSHVPAKQQIQQKLLEDIERKYGFQPIDQPASPEMEELSGQFHNE